MGPIFETDAYFKEIPAARNATMFVLRELLFEVFPAISESLQDGIPSYALNGRKLCTLANYPDYIAFSFTPFDLLMEFEAALEHYDWHRNQIRFTKIDIDTMSLLEEIVRFVGNNYHKSGTYRKAQVLQQHPIPVEV